MDSITLIELSIFLAATFAAALVAGLSGFAFGLVAAAAWLHVLTPTRSAALIVAFGLIVQAAAMWRLRHALRFERLLPFLGGAFVGVPLGIFLLRTIPAASVRAAVGIVLMAFSLYSLTQPKLPQFSRASRLADGLAGTLNGIVGGATGLAGILVVVWCTVRSWPKDEQRSVFQPVAVLTFALTALGLGATGSVDKESLLLFGFGLPFLLVGTWLGLKLYGRINEAAFRRIALLLLLVSGVSLLL